MFSPTSNEYKFQWLQTGISGDGITKVYLPEPPPDEEVLFKEENKWTRPEMPEYLRKSYKEWILKSDPENKRMYDPDFVSPLAKEINEWIDLHWKWTEEGIWFWNKGIKTYITPFYAFYLTAWDTSFGFPEYRETDKEITYWIKYWEEDPDSFGGMLNTIRRAGKSALMGAWIVFRTIRNHKHLSGMQGENDLKIAAFYAMHIQQPFYKLPHYFKPTYDTDSKQTEGINFNLSPRKGRLYDPDDVDVLESEIGYRVSKEAAYDQAKLDSYCMEEPGKTLVANVSDRWDFVKPCLTRGKFIRGKAFMGTTVEFMDVGNRGGKAYQKMFFGSDINHKNKIGRTSTGLYAAFLPGDCVLEGYFDEWGYPMRDEARAWILAEREDKEDNPKDHSSIIRKYPLYLREIFYINTERCEFNAKILQERRAELVAATDSMLNKVEFFWIDNKRFTKVGWRHNPQNGWAKIGWMPTNPELEANLVETRWIQGKPHYAPKNDGRFAAGLDPIDHGVTTEDSVSNDEFQSARRSRPVLMVHLKYDSSVDGLLTPEIMKERAAAKYKYQTGIDILMMDNRPNDPNVLFERVLMICWFFGVSVHIENQKPGCIRYFQEHNCGLFIMNRYQPLESQKGKTRAASDDGTPASTMVIQEYTSAISTDVEYFGHTYKFIEVVDDLLVFSPAETRKYDYAVSKGFTCLAVKMKPKVKPREVLNLDDFFNAYDHNGQVTNYRQHNAQPETY